MSPLAPASPKPQPILMHSPLPAVCARLRELCLPLVRVDVLETPASGTSLEYRTRLAEVLLPLEPLIRRFPADFMSPRGFDSKLRGNAASLKSFFVVESETIRVFALVVAALHAIGESLRYTAHQTAQMIVAGQGPADGDSAPSFRPRLEEVSKILQCASETPVLPAAFFADAEEFRSVCTELTRLRQELGSAIDYANRRPPTDTDATRAKYEAQATLDRFWKSRPDLVEYEFYRFVFGAESPLSPACRSIEGLLRVTSLGSDFGKRLDVIMSR